MSQKSTKFDEFTSLFRSVVRPVLEIEPLALKKLLVLVDVRCDVDKFQGICNVVESMHERFRPTTKLFCPLFPGQDHRVADDRLDELKDRLPSKGDSVGSEIREGFPAQLILEEAERFEADFLVMTSLFGEMDRGLEGYTLGAIVDKVLSQTTRPILLVEGEVLEADKLWVDMLLFVEESKTAEPCLAATRALARKEAKTRLLHVIDDHMLSIVERGIEVATELETSKTTEALTRALKKDMEHFMQSAKELLDRTGHDSSYDITVGDPVEVVRSFIKEHGPRLLVCNSVAPTERLVDSVAYNLAAYLREVPLLLV